MLSFAIRNGLFNGTLWAGVIFAALLAAARSRGRDHSAGAALQRVQSFATSPLFIALFALATFLNLGLALYKGSVAPRDIMQDITSAQEFLRGRSLYPPNMGELMRTDFANEPPPISFERWASSFPAREDESERSSLERSVLSLAERERQERADIVESDWKQAHPPLMSLAVAPLVATLGVFGAYYTVVGLSATALFVTLWLMERGLSLRLTWRQKTALALAAFGWVPVIDVFRVGQSGLLLGALMVGAWYLLRQRRPIAAGVLIGIATGLKIYPGLLLVYLALRERRALVAALLTLLGLTGLVAVLCGVDCFREWSDTVRYVVSEYRAYPDNISLLGLISRTINALHWTELPAREIGTGVSLVFVAGLTTLLLCRSAGGREAASVRDLEFALFLVLMVLLSPVAWEHYVVVVLFSLAVLGMRTLTWFVNWRRTGAFTLITLLLCVPGTLFVTTSQRLEASVGPLAANLLILGVRTYVLFAVAVWLAALIVWDRKAASKLVPVAV
jgi:hypothetical protein